MKNADSAADMTQAIKSYGLAIALPVLAMFLRWVVQPYIGTATPFITLALLISAWYGGLRPGLISTAFLCATALLKPEMLASPPSTSNPWGIALTFMVNGVVISLLMESLHRAHRRVAQSAQEISAINERFHMLVDSVSDYGILMLDTKGNITSWNKGAQQVTGYTAEEAIGQPFSLFYPPEEIARGKPAMEIRMANKTGRFEEEGWRLRKDGSRFWANVVLRAVYDESGELCGYSKVTRDMSDRREAEERHRQLIQEQAARVEAESANRAKDQFLSIVSHELRTPLNAILGWTTLLRGGQLDNQMSATALETIERSSRVQSRLVEDLLDISRMMAGKMSIEVTPLNLSSVLEAAHGQVLPRAEEKQIAINVDCEDAPLEVSGDAVRLEQVFSNLLNNAIKFTPSGGRIEIALKRDGSNVIASVTDNGHGIKEDMLPHIFERFRQADSSQTRQHGGLGLGLAIARYVVEAHNGTLTATSQGEGQGACFTVELPLLVHGAESASDDTPEQTQPQNDATLTEAVISKEAGES